MNLRRPVTFVATALLLGAVQHPVGVHADETARIVAVGGSITEILYALGQQDKIVAVDSTSLYPSKAAQEKPNVGYVRQLSAEGVLGLHPTQIIAIEGAGPKETIDVIEKAGIPFLRIPDHFSADGVLEKIALTAKAVGATAKSRCLVEATRRQFDALADLRSKIVAAKRVMFVLSFVNGKAMVAGKNTAADGIIALAGGTNASGPFEGYKQISDEAIVGAQPDVILAMQRPGFAMSADEVFSHPAFAQTPAAKSKNFASFDGLYLLGFGPRTAIAANELAHTLYPTLAPLEPASQTAPCFP